MDAYCQIEMKNIRLLDQKFSLTHMACSQIVNNIAPKAIDGGRVDGCLGEIKVAKLELPNTLQKQVMATMEWMLWSEATPSRVVMQTITGNLS